MAIPLAVRDGKTAVIIHDHYGFEWSTYFNLGSQEAEWLLFHAGLIAAVESRNLEQLCAVLTKLGLIVFADTVSKQVGLIDELKIVWLPQRTKFTVYSHDGRELLFTDKNLIYTVY